MYVPPHFAENRPALLHGLMDQYPLATVVAVTAEGLQANHIPLMLESGTGSLGTLRGHVARANSLWRDLETGAEVLAIFQGSSRYISPNWYPSKLENGQVVPTWNYTVVHARGRITWIHDAVWLREFLESLTERHERGYANPWRMSDAPTKYIDGMLRAIVGFEIAIDKLAGKWKVSQNRSEQDRAGVVSSLSGFADDASQQMARLVEFPDHGTSD
jgi:transcriptional regulator